jgi:hypothetical protein
MKNTDGKSGIHFLKTACRCYYVKDGRKGVNGFARGLIVLEFCSPNNFKVFSSKN